MLDEVTKTFFPASPTILTLNTSIEPAEYVVYNGPLQGISVSEVANGKSGISQTSVCFTAEGEYLLTAEAIQLKSTRNSLLSKLEIKVIVRDGQ